LPEASKEGVVSSNLTGSVFLCRYLVRIRLNTQFSQNLFILQEFQEIMTAISIYLSEGVRIMFKSWKHRLFPKKYEGNAEKICRAVIKDCWNGRYFQASTTNFSQFWTRDFGFCTKSLLKLGYREEVQQTLRYAINRFQKAKKITATITPRGRAYDMPTMAVDSLPWLIHSINIAKFSYHAHKNFLNKEIHRFFEKVIDPKTGLVRSTHFSSMKDFSVRKSACYDNCMVALLAKDLKMLKLHNPFSTYAYPQLIKKYFWQGNYFFDDMERKEYVAGDANIFPFVFGLIADKDMMNKAVHALQDAKLDQPFPLKYTQSRKPVNWVWQEIFMRNYESDALWMHMGPLYVKFLQQVDREKATETKQKYTELIEKHKNFLEVFTSAGKPYGNFWFYCDEGMLWACNYLTL
jgi:hypothetical protein